MKIDDPRYIAKLAIADLLSREGYMCYDVEPVHALHYAEACAAFGAARIAGMNGEANVLSLLVDRYAPDKLPRNTANHVDANVCGIIPIELYIQTKLPDLLEQGLLYADGQWAHPLPNGLSAQTRFWIDDMWMIGALQTTAFRATGNPVYLERCALELDAYRERLQRPSGLFYHGPESPHYWGRGNGWVAAGFAELLSLLPESNSRYASLLAGFRAMAAALKRYQAPGGMWRQLIDNGGAWNETSCTAMFGYAIALGVRCALLPPDEYRPVAEQAWHSLASYVTEDGLMTEVCAGTGQKDDVGFYLARPRVTGDLHGQAALLWFAFEMMQK